MKSLRVTSQSGQALIAGLIVLMIAFAGLIVLFSRSQITIEKQRLTSASDAAAYSAALWRARVMNFDAYANRAIVAQEVAVAQAVTLTSWAKYFETFTQNSATVAAAYPPLGAVMSTIATLAETSRVVTEAAAEAEIFARAAKDTGYKFLLEDGQFLMGLTANGFALSMITTEVARANHPDYHAYVLPDQGTSFAFVKHYESDEDRARLKDVVLRSLDPFTGGSRDEKLRLLFLPSLRCLGSVQRLHKRGGTVLSDDMERWESVDTTSLHDMKKGFLGIGCKEYELIPVGYGASEAADTENQSSVSSNANDVNKNLASKVMASGQIKSFGNYGGLSKIRELDYEQLSNKKFPVSEIAVLARIKKDDLRTADTTNLGVGRFRTVDELDDNRLKAISAAQVYFRKPTQSASGEAEEIEYASLFSPYWQARLIAPTEAQRALAAAAK
jgi:hypothetical protein